MSPPETILYEHPLVTARSAQLPRLADDPQTPRSLIAVREHAACRIKDNLTDALDVFGWARSRRPLLPLDDVPQVVDFRSTEDIAPFQEPPLPLDSGQASADPLLCGWVEAGMRDVLQDTLEFVRSELSGTGGRLQDEPIGSGGLASRHHPHNNSRVYPALPVGNVRLIAVGREAGARGRRRHRAPQRRDRPLGGRRHVRIAGQYASTPWLKRAGSARIASPAGERRARRPGRSHRRSR